MPLTGEKYHRFFTKVSAAVIVNQAIISCSIAGCPITIVNVILFVGDFFDPENKDFHEVTIEIERQLYKVVGDLRVAAMN